jgi:hypothetical protein
MFFFYRENSVYFPLLNLCWLKTPLSCWLHFRWRWLICRKGLRLTKRCRLSWLANSALVYKFILLLNPLIIFFMVKIFIEPKCGGGGLRGLSQWVKLHTGAQINFGPNSILYLTYDLSLHDVREVVLFYLLPPVCNTFHITYLVKLIFSRPQSLTVSSALTVVNVWYSVVEKLLIFGAMNPSPSPPPPSLAQV